MPLPFLWHAARLYEVQTDIYEGPLDLLLQLIESAELDITRLSLSKVTDQYLERLRSLEVRDPVEVSAFLLIAAKLVLIKSQVLLPQPRVEDGDSFEEDAGEKLVKQLIIYKQIKNAAAWLRNREKSGLRTYLRVSSPIKAVERLDMGDLSINNLASAYMAFFLAKPAAETLGNLVTISTITIRKKIGEIFAIISHTKSSTFNNLVSSEGGRLEIIVTFLALLELIKHHSIEVQQESMFGEIQIESSSQTELDFEMEF